MNDDDNTEADDDATTTTPQTGYGRPPAAHRFQKGKSGNPRGRPKGAMGKRQSVEKVLFEKHVVVENGRKARRATFELIMILLRNLAFEGNSRAYTLYEKLEAEYDPPPLDTPTGHLVVPGRLTKTAWAELFGKREPMISEE